MDSPGFLRRPRKNACSRTSRAAPPTPPRSCTPRNSASSALLVLQICQWERTPKNGGHFSLLLHLGNLLLQAGVLFGYGLREIFLVRHKLPRNLRIGERQNLRRENRGVHGSGFINR